MTKVTDPMLIEPYNANPMRMDRVEQLRELYERYDAEEVQVMDLPEASVNSFRNRYHAFQSLLSQAFPTKT